MMSFQQTLKKLYLPFVESEKITCPVSHYKRMSTFPFLVWAEDGENDSFHADNKKQNFKLTGYVDYYTRAEFDETVDAVNEILNDEGLAWSLASVDYDETINLIHYRWRWEVV